MGFLYFQHFELIRLISETVQIGTFCFATISLFALITRAPRLNTPGATLASIYALSYLPAVACFVGWFLLHWAQALSLPAISSPAIPGTLQSLPGMEYFHYRQLTAYAQDTLQASAVSTLLLCINALLAAVSVLHSWLALRVAHIANMNLSNTGRPGMIEARYGFLMAMLLAGSVYAVIRVR